MKCALCGEDKAGAILREKWSKAVKESGRLDDFDGKVCVTCYDYEDFRAEVFGKLNMMGGMIHNLSKKLDAIYEKQLEQS